MTPPARAAGSGEKKAIALKIGDEVTVRAWGCEVDGMQGTVIGIDPDAMLPIMLSLSNSREWPFAEWELELHP